MYRYESDTEADPSPPDPGGGDRRRLCGLARPAIRPEGTIVEVGEEGVFRVLFEDGTRRWYRAEELSLSRPR